MSLNQSDVQVDQPETDPKEPRGVDRREFLGIASAVGAVGLFGVSARPESTNSGGIQIITVQNQKGREERIWMRTLPQTDLTVPVTDSPFPSTGDYYPYPNSIESPICSKDVVFDLMRKRNEKEEATTASESQVLPDGKYQLSFPFIENNDPIEALVRQIESALKEIYGASEDVNFFVHRYNEETGGLDNVPIAQLNDEEKVLLEKYCKGIIVMRDVTKRLRELKEKLIFFEVVSDEELRIPSNIKFHSLIIRKGKPGSTDLWKSSGKYVGIDVYVDSDPEKYRKSVLPELPHAAGLISFGLELDGGEDSVKLSQKNAYGASYYWMNEALAMLAVDSSYGESTRKSEEQVGMVGNIPSPVARLFLQRHNTTKRPDFSLLTSILLEENWAVMMKEIIFSQFPEFISWPAVMEDGSEADCITNDTWEYDHLVEVYAAVIGLTKLLSTLHSSPDQLDINNDKLQAFIANLESTSHNKYLKDRIDYLKKLIWEKFDAVQINTDLYKRLMNPRERLFYVWAYKSTLFPPMEGYTEQDYHRINVADIYGVNSSGEEDDPIDPNFESWILTPKIATAWAQVVEDGQIRWMDVTSIIVRHPNRPEEYGPEEFYLPRHFTDQKTGKTYTGVTKYAMQMNLEVGDFKFTIPTYLSVEL